MLSKSTSLSDVYKKWELHVPAICVRMMRVVDTDDEKMAEMSDDGGEEDGPIELKVEGGIDPGLDESMEEQEEEEDSDGIPLYEPFDPNNRFGDSNKVFENVLI